MKPDPTSLERISAEAAEWFTSIRDGELSPAERDRFVGWLEASPLHVQEYLGVAETWGAIAAADAWPEMTKEELISAARTTSNVVMLAPGAGDKVTEKKRRRGWPIAAIAVIAAAAAVLSGVLLELLPAQTYATARGEQRSIVLEDGSVIQLNTLSRISIHFSDYQRRVELSDGEAFFRVAHDTQRPFLVVTPSATVRVLGTEFNVYARDELLRVDVVDGRVQVSDLPAATGRPDDLAKKAGGHAPAVPERISLAASESIEMHAGGPLIRSEHRPPAYTTAWMQRRLVFENQRLDDVIDEFNRYTPRQMHVTNPELASLRISGTFDADEPETLVAYLEQIQRVEVVRRGMAVYLAPAGNTP